MDVSKSHEADLLKYQPYRGWISHGCSKERKNIYYTPKRDDSYLDRILQPSHREEGLVLRPLMGDKNDVWVVRKQAYLYLYGEALRPDQSDMTLW